MLWTSERLPDVTTKIPEVCTGAPPKQKPGGGAGGGCSGKLPCPLATMIKLTKDESELVELMDEGHILLEVLPGKPVEGELRSFKVGCVDEPKLENEEL